MLPSSHTMVTTLRQCAQVREGAKKQICSRGLSAEIAGCVGAQEYGRATGVITAPATRRVQCNTSGTSISFLFFSCCQLGLNVGAWLYA
jgi:hypothetical protein